MTGKKPQHLPEGRHVLMDGHSVPRERLEDIPSLLEDMVAACQRAGATVLDSVVHPFEPSGASIVLVLAESHLSIHTYPEHGGYFGDFFTCGDLDPLPAAAWLSGRVGGECILRTSRRRCGNRAAGGAARKTEAA